MRKEKALSLPPGIVGPHHAAALILRPPGKSRRLGVWVTGSPELSQTLPHGEGAAFPGGASAQVLQASCLPKCPRLLREGKSPHNCATRAPGSEEPRSRRQEPTRQVRLSFPTGPPRPVFPFLGFLGPGHGLHPAAHGRRGSASGGAKSFESGENALVCCPLATCSGHERFLQGSQAATSSDVRGAGG